MAKLILVRHGESEWNALELWTGWTDVSLTPKGRRQAQAAGELIKDLEIDLAVESDLKRSTETLDEILKTTGQMEVERVVTPAIKERDYGDFTGRNKFEIENAYGYEVFDKWHRGWDFPLPHGETLKNVYERVLAYFEAEVLPRLKEGKNILVSGHGNSLRALIKRLENISDQDAGLIEIDFGQVLVYEFDSQGKIVAKELRGTNGITRTIPLDQNIEPA